MSACLSFIQKLAWRLCQAMDRSNAVRWCCALGVWLAITLLLLGLAFGLGGAVELVRSPLVAGCILVVGGVRMLSSMPGLNPLGLIVMAVSFAAVVSHPGASASLLTVLTWLLILAALGSVPVRGGKEDKS